MARDIKSDLRAKLRDNHMGRKRGCPLHIPSLVASRVTFDMPVAYTPCPQSMELWKWGKGEELDLRLGPWVKILHGEQTFDGKTRLELGPRTAMTNRRE